MQTKLLQRSHRGVEILCSETVPLKMDWKLSHPELLQSRFLFSLSSTTYSNPMTARPLGERTIIYSTCSILMVTAGAGFDGIHFLFPFAELLGIKDLFKPDYEDPVVCRPGDVPVFWPSQLSSLEAVGSYSMWGLEGAINLTWDGPCWGSSS